jgi:hypothetical protein
MFGVGVGHPQVAMAAQKTMEDVAISVYQTPRDRLASVLMDTTLLMQTNVLKLSGALPHQNPVRMVRNAFPWSNFVMDMLIV